MEDRTVWEGSALLSPVPAVLVSVGDENEKNVFTVAWTGTLNTRPPKTYISVRPERHSYAILERTGEFVINLPSCDLVKAVDFCGVRSGKNIDKFKEMKLTPKESESVKAPYIDECPISLECRVSDKIHLGTHTMFIADILKISVKNELLDKNGKLHIKKCNLLAYAHGEYFSLGERLGTFGYSVRKKKKTNKKSRNS